MNETSITTPAEPGSRVDRGRDGRNVPSPSDQAGSGRSGPGRIWGLIGLVVLTAVTSLVVATISVWLVPVYMTAMVLIFAAPRSPRPAAAATTPEASPAESPEDVAPPRADDVATTPARDAEAVADPAAADEQATAKPRKRRAKAKRSRKSAQAAEAPATEPTWIRVGPGKFVRADDVRAEPPADAVPTIATAADPTIEPEATAAADVEPDADAWAAAATTPEDSRPVEPDEEHGNAPSTLAGTVDEEHGNAPTALVEPRIIEALPDDVADDEPEPDAEPIEPAPAAEDETWIEARSYVVDEAKAEPPADEPDVRSETQPTTPATVASPVSERSAPGAGATATASRRVVPARGLGLVRRVARSRERLDRVRAPRPRGTVARPARSGRRDDARVRGTDRHRRRFSQGARRHHPRSPPPRRS